MAELCRVYEISRESGLRWIKRIRGEGEQGLEDRSRAPRMSSIRPMPISSSRCCNCVGGTPTRGPRKLLYVLGQKQPQVGLGRRPAVGALLKREGLTARSASTADKTPPYTQPFQNAIEPNQLWCADFKGWFRTRDQQRIDPLTIGDAASRYLLRLPSGEKRPTPSRCVRHMRGSIPGHGLPLAIRSGPLLCLQSGCWTVCFVDLLDEAGDSYRSGLSLVILNRTVDTERIASHLSGGDGSVLRLRIVGPNKRHSIVLNSPTTSSGRRTEALGMKTPAKCYAPSPRAYPSRRRRNRTRRRGLSGPQQSTRLRRIQLEGPEDLYH